MFGAPKCREKRREVSLPSIAIIRVLISSVVITLVVYTAGCSSENRPAKPAPPVPLKLDEITVKESGTGPGFTPTAVGIEAAIPIHTPTAKLPPPTEKKTVPLPPPTKKEAPEKTAKKPETKVPETKAPETKKPETKTPPPSKPQIPSAGMYTLQVGAYVVDENLKEAEKKVAALGLVPYVKEMRRPTMMYCVIVEAGTTEKKARDTAAALSSKGFKPEVLVGGGGLFDAAAEIYYYRDDADKAAERVTGLGYRPRVEHRTVEATFKGLRVGAYRTIDEAERDMALLRTKGFSPVILKSDQ